jgi:hypothetical protein
VAAKLRIDEGELEGVGALNWIDEEGPPERAFR